MFRKVLIVISILIVSSSSMAAELSPGLAGTLFKGEDFTRPHEDNPVYLKSPDIAMTVKGPDYIEPDDHESNWSARWGGLIEGPYTGEVTITAQAEAGIRVIIDAKVVIDGLADSSKRSGKVKMTKGMKVPIVIEFICLEDNDQLRLYWQWPEQAKSIIPAEVLSYDPAKIGDTAKEVMVGDDAFPQIEIPKGDQHECVERHVVVYDEPGRYAGWPANGGFWMWGDKMAVSFECGWFKDKPDWEDGHARDMDRSNEDIVAHSSDGGLTWTHKTYPAMSSDDGMVLLTQELDFSKEGFAFKCQGSRFYYTYDYGLTWAGPFQLNIQDRPFDDDDIESHTCYLVTGPKEGYFLFGVEPDGAEDRFYCSKTTDGGKSFQFLGWISPSIEDAPKYERWAVYSAVEVSKGHLIAALRRKINKRGGKVERLNWIDVYESKDAGKTWSHLSKIADTDVVNSDFNGNPPSVIKLKDGRLAVTYGFRAKPTAMCAKLSKDNGKTWGDVVILRRGSRNWDFGYSRSLQKADGKVITVYYWATPEHRNQYLTATIWDPSKVN
ncbi:MAG: exo-alpha-sialidase [Planctomycetota bacterium]